jgi:hypothetical protein
MARLSSVSDTWEENKGWVFLAFFGFLLFAFRKVFISAGEAAGAGTEALVGGITQSATIKADKAKAKAANGGHVNFTDDQIAQFTADADSLATYLGRGEGVGLQNIFRDQQSAFSLLKQRYSRLRLNNNKPFYFKAGTVKNGQGVAVSQNVETAASQKNAINWRVLIPFYKTASGGHDLQADIRYYITDSKYKALLKWIL